MILNHPSTFKIISGGQTGVDRAALDIALSLSIDHGGWCPRGRRAEDGILDSRYQLTETRSSDYSERTRRNVQDSDGTLILNIGEPEGGTALTRHIAEQCGKPCRLVDPRDGDTIENIHEWIDQNNIRTLNVAGPRASKQKDIYPLSCNYLQRLFSSLQD